MTKMFKPDFKIIKRIEDLSREITWSATRTTPTCSSTWLDRVGEHVVMKRNGELRMICVRCFVSMPKFDITSV